VFGADWPLRYLAYAAQVGGSPPDPVLDPAGMQNWRGLTTHLLGDTPAAGVATLVLAGGSLALLGWAWLGAGRGQWQPGTAAWDRRWIATLLVGLLLSTYLLPHDLALAVVPGWMLVA